jgi:hypothetical protein
MKKFFLIFLAFSFLFAYDTLWFRVYDTGWDEYGARVGIDPFGDIIVAGSTGNEEAILLIKYSPSGETIWSRIIDDEDELSLTGLAVDKEGNIILVGSYYREPEEVGAYIVKSDNGGNILWVKKFTINNWAGLCGVVCDDSNNIIVSGFYDEEGDNIILIKYSPNGDSVWVKRYNLGEELESICGLMQDKEGNIIGTGAIGSLFPSIYDLLTVKFDKNGDIIWISRIDFDENDWGTDVTIDSANNIYVCGFTGDFDLIHSFVVKYNKYGDTLWARFYENYYSLGAAISIDKLGNVPVTGYIKDTCAITLLIKYSPLGDTIFSQLFNFSPNRGMWAEDMVLVNDSNYIYIAGTFDNGRNGDIYLMKLFYQPAIKEKVSYKILSTANNKAKEFYDITGKRIKNLERMKEGIYFFKDYQDKYYKKKIILK